MGYLWGAGRGAGALLRAVSRVVYWWRVCRDRQGLPHVLAEIERLAAEREARSALTEDDRAWLTAMGWKGRVE